MQVNNFPCKTIEETDKSFYLHISLKTYSFVQTNKLFPQTSHSGYFPFEMELPLEVLREKSICSWKCHRNSSNCFQRVWSTINCSRIKMVATVSRNKTIAFKSTFSMAFHLCLLASVTFKMQMLAELKQFNRWFEMGFGRTHAHTYTHSEYCMEFISVV